MFHKLLIAYKKIKGNVLQIPIVYNTSSYENVHTIAMLNGLVDIYLADLKYFDDSLGMMYSNCSHYFEFATKAIEEMYRQVGSFVIQDDLMEKGIIVRVLILPGHIDDAKKIIDYLYSRYKDNIIISIMNQYTPMECLKYHNLNRKVSDKEYDEVINYACSLGIKYAFGQEGETQSESFIPDFDCSIV